MCNWKGTIQGVGDTLVLLLLVSFVNITLPFLLWGSLSFPNAYIIDFLFGDILRVGFVCNDLAKLNATHSLVIGQSSKYVICARPEFDLSQPQTTKQVMIMVQVIAVLLFCTVTLKIFTTMFKTLWMKTIAKVL